MVGYNRFVHVGSAGVTRPERPGLDLSKQPPAVRLNKELDFILTYKLKVCLSLYTLLRNSFFTRFNALFFCEQGEDLIRESGIPYAIVRPCALTEEPAGADLIFDQGDNITVFHFLATITPLSFNFNITNLGFYYTGEGLERRGSTYMHRCFRKPACSKQDIRG